MLTNDANSEAILPPNSGVLKEWRHTQRPRAGAVTNRAKDLGVAQRGGSTSPVTYVKDAARATYGKAKRVATLRGGKVSRILVTRVDMHTSTMYACEVDPLTLGDIHQIRLGVAVVCVWNGDTATASPPCFLPHRDLRSPRPYTTTE